jgi:hypothetical protein
LSAFEVLLPVSECHLDGTLPTQGKLKTLHLPTIISIKDASITTLI